MVPFNAATGYVAKISMLRLNIGSGKLSSCMLSIGRGPESIQGKASGLPPLALFAFGSEAPLKGVERHHSKPKSKLTASNFNMLTFGDLG